MTPVQLDASWLVHLQDEFDQTYMQDLRAFLVAEKQQGKVIYPRGSEYFKALDTTRLEDVKVVILGQDPYHGPGQAHGLCFSVAENVPVPPSLKNIYKEIQADFSRQDPFPNGNLVSWAEQGVLLLNSVLSVEAHQAASHRNKGWEQFTDKVIEVVSGQRQNCVFLLWGSYAQKKGQMIDADRHKVLKAPHPSPLSAHRGFLGCRHFSLCNTYLKQTDQSEIDWFS